LKIPPHKAKSRDAYIRANLYDDQTTTLPANPTRPDTIYTCTPKVWLDYSPTNPHSFLSYPIVLFSSQNISILLAHVPALPKPPKKSGQKAAHASANSFLFLPSLAGGFLWLRRRRARWPRSCCTTTAFVPVRFSFCSLLALRCLAMVSHWDDYIFDMAASRRDHKTTREDTSDRRIHTYISLVGSLESFTNLPAAFLRHHTSMLAYELL
jgi:hypothetical protein